MFQVGEKVHWYDDPNLQGYVLRSNVKDTVVDWGKHGIQEKYTKDLRKVGEISVKITINKPTWQDTPDTSLFNDIRPGINAACAYAPDGSCWLWAVGPDKHNVLGEGRSIDRATAKSDAEFFVANYKPENTSERDEIRRKLEKSWSGRS